MVRAVSVLIVINAVVSFRSVPRIFAAIIGNALVPAFKVPCYNSVINWTMRYGLHRLSNVSKIKESWFAIVDMSINTGLGKVLVVLRVSISAWNNRGPKALTLADCEAITVEVSESWNADSVEQTLQKTFSEAGWPSFIVKDRGSDITAGVRRLGIPDVYDIGHATANALKDTFSKDKWFAAFLSLVSLFAAKLRQSRLAHLTPPKIRTAGRFQGITRIVEWAERIITFYASHAPENHSEVIRPLLRKLQALRRPIERLARIVVAADQIQRIVKTRGLNISSASTINMILSTMSANCPVKRRLRAWVDDHLNVFLRLKTRHPELNSLPASSDIIESLFGRFKHVLARSPRPELGTITAMIAGLCGKHDADSIMEALAITHTNDLEAFRSGHFPTSIEAKRREFRDKCRCLANESTPKSGNALGVG